MSTKKPLSLFFILSFALILVASALLAGVVLPTALHSASANSYIGYSSYTLDNIAPVTYFGDSFDLFYNTWTRGENGNFVRPSYHSNIKPTIWSNRVQLDLTSAFNSSFSTFTASGNSLPSSGAGSLNAGISNIIGNTYYPYFSVPSFYISPAESGSLAQVVGKGFSISSQIDFDDVTYSARDGEYGFFTYNLLYAGLDPKNFSGSLGSVLTVDVGWIPTGYDAISWDNDVHFLQLVPSSSAYQDNIADYSLKYVSYNFSLPYNVSSIGVNHTYAGTIVSYRIKSFTLVLDFGDYDYGDNHSPRVDLYGQSAYLGYVKSSQVNDPSFNGIGLIGYNFNEVADSVFKNASSTAYQQGVNYGKGVGYDQGYSVGYEKGYNTSYYSGYTEGYSTGLSTSDSGNWSSLFRSVFNSPLEAIFGKYDATTGKRTGGFLVLDIPIGDQTLDVSNFLLGLLSALLILAVARIIIKFAL